MLSFSENVKNFLWPSLPYTQLDWYNRSFGRELQINGVLNGFDYHGTGMEYGEGQKTHLTSATARLSAHKALVIKPLYSAYYIYKPNAFGIVEHHFNPLALLDPRRFVDMSFEFLHGVCDLLAQVDHNPSTRLRGITGKTDWQNRSTLSRVCLVASAILRFPVSLVQTVWNTFAHPFDTHLLPYAQIYRAYKTNKTLPPKDKVSNGKLAALAVLHTVKTGLVIACVASVIGKPFIPAVTGFFSSVGNYFTGGILGKVAEAAAAQVVSSYTAPVVANAVVVATGAQLVSNTVAPRNGVKLRDQVRARFDHDMSSRVNRDALKAQETETSAHVVVEEKKKRNLPRFGKVVSFLRPEPSRGLFGYRRLPELDVQFASPLGTTPADGIKKRK